MRRATETGSPGGFSPPLRRSALAVLAAAAGVGCRSGPQPTSTLEPSLIRERAAEMRRIEFDLAPNARLVLEDFDGDVHVTAAHSRRPELLAHLGTISRDPVTARAMLGRIDFELERDGRELTIRLLRPPRDEEPFRTNSRYDLSVPPGVAVLVKSEVGGIAVHGAFRYVSAVTNYGAVEVTGTRGPVVVDNGAGNVEVRDIEGTRVTLASNHGKLHVSDVTCEELSAHGRSGSVEVSRVAARRTSVRTSYGQVDVADVVGDELVVRAGFSEVSLVSCTEPSISVDIEAGEVFARGLRGGLRVHAPSATTTVEEHVGALTVASTYGSIRAAGVFTGLDAVTKAGEVQVEARPGSVIESPWRLESRYADVGLSLPRELSFELDARTDYGDVKLAFPVVVEAGSSIDRLRIRGAVNGGGTELRMRSVKGDVHLTPPETPSDPLGAH